MRQLHPPPELLLLLLVAGDVEVVPVDDVVAALLVVVPPSAPPPVVKGADELDVAASDVELSPSPLSVAEPSPVAESVATASPDPSLDPSVVSPLPSLVASLAESVDPSDPASAARDDPDHESPNAVTASVKTSGLSLIMIALRSCRFTNVS